MVLQLCYFCGMDSDVDLSTKYCISCYPDFKNNELLEENPEFKSVCTISFLERWKGIATLEDAILSGIEPEKLENIATKKELKQIASLAGKSRRKKWPLFPNPDEKKEICAYLAEGLKKRQFISPKLFNAFYGIGHQSYFDSWNDLRKEAGFKCNPPTQPAFSSKRTGKRAILDYAVNTILSGKRLKQKNLRDDLHIHYDLYGYSSIAQIRKEALDIVVYQILLRKPDISLSKLSKKVGYCKKTIKQDINIDELRALLKDNKRR